MTGRRLRNVKKAIARERERGYFATLSMTKGAFSMTRAGAHHDEGGAQADKGGTQHDRIPSRGLACRTVTSDPLESLAELNS